MQNLQKLFSSRIVQLIIGAVALVGLLVVIQYMQGSKFDISGTFTLSDPQLDFKNGEVCWGSGGYKDISNIAQVKVSDGADKILAVASLGDGKMDGDYKCVFSFTVQGVPRSDIYQFEVANRGKITYSQNDIKENNNTVELSLGN